MKARPMSPAGSLTKRGVAALRDRLDGRPLLEEVDGVRRRPPAAARRVPQPAVPDDFDLVWARARRQRRVRQFTAALGAAGVLALAIVVLPGMLQSGTPDSLEIVGEPDQRLHVPDVVGLALGEAQQVLGEDGLEGQAASGTYERRAWQDPDDPDAVVVSQAPPPATWSVHARSSGSVPR